MILVTLGTQDKKFYRLLEAIEKQISNGVIKEEVVVQAGYSSNFKSKKMKIFDLIPMEEFDKLISDCDLLITHGGVGSIITGLKHNKKIIAAARLKEFGEHTNDHQLQIIENFREAGYILSLENFDELNKVLNKTKKFKPKKYKSNSNSFNKLLEIEIDRHLKHKTNIKNIVNLLFLFCICLFVAVSVLKTIFKPIDIVVGENRYANKYEKVNLNNYINGSLQDNYEKTLSDQLIFSSKIKLINNYIDAVTVKKFLDIIINKDNINYYSLGSVSLYGKDNLVYNPYNFNQVEEALSNKVKKLNKTMELYSNVDYYFYYIEKDTDINFNNNLKLGAYEYIKKNLDSENILNFEINNFEEFSNYFYKTDHHWNYKGSYKAYLKLINFLGLENPKKPIDEICLQDNFIGSKGLSTVYYETFCAYKFNLDELDIKINGKKGTYGIQNEISNGKHLSATYGSFYGSDEGEVIFDSHDNSKENVLIIGNSYDNAILWLLAEKYNKTISIDLRNYEHYMGKKFNYEEYIEKNDIDKVLFIGNVYFFTSEEFDVIE